jgi:hypothetical protein
MIDYMIIWATACLVLTNNADIFVTEFLCLEGLTGGRLKGTTWRRQKWGIHLERKSQGNAWPGIILCLKRIEILLYLPNHSIDMEDL